MAYVPTPVLYNNKQYNSASEALQAYIDEYEGKEAKYSKRKSLYERQFKELFTGAPTTRPMSDFHRRALHAYDRMYKEVKDHKRQLQNSLNASAAVLEMIEADRLPSPTRSGVSRVSLESAANTDILLSANPLYDVPEVDTKSSPKAKSLNSSLKRDRFDNIELQMNNQKSKELNQIFPAIGISHTTSKDMHNKLDFDKSSSSSTASSIITGHMMPAKKTSRCEVHKVSSTPNKKYSLDDNTKFKTIHSPHDSSLRDSINKNRSLLHASKSSPLPLHSPTYQMLIQDTPIKQRSANTTPVKTRTEMVHSNGDLVSILKSPHLNSVKRKAGSHVSFTTDDLLLASPYLRESPNRRRSKSLPRPLSNESSHKFSSLPSHGNDLKSSSRRKISFDHINNSSVNISTPVRSKLETTPTKYASGDVSLALNRSHLEAEAKSDAVVPKYSDFIQKLMDEINSGSANSSTISKLTDRDNLDLQRRDLRLKAQNDEAGCGFLEQIKNILSSEGPPSVSQYLDVVDDENHHQKSSTSLDTDDILNGDRSWEKLAFDKVDQLEMQPVNSHSRGKGNNEIYNTESHDANLGVQPGSLEALKNMLFTVQNLSTPSSTDALNSPSGLLATDDNKASSDSFVYSDTSLNDSISKLLSPQTKELLKKSSSSADNQQPHVVKTMEHLSKLKDLLQKPN